MAPLSISYTSAKKRNKTNNAFTGPVFYRAYKGGEHMILYTDPKLIGQFLSLCNSNWHMCCYVFCKNCGYTRACEYPDFLFVLSEAGSPVVLPAADAAILFSTHLNPEECLLTLSVAQFCVLYENYLKKLQVPKEQCPIRYLQNLLTEQCYDW